MGRQTQPRNKHRRLAAQPSHIHLLGFTVGPPLHRDIRHARQQAIASLQCPRARPNRRMMWTAYICPTDFGLRGDQFVQPPVDAPTRPRPKVTPTWRRSDSHRTVLARQAMVPTTGRTFRRKKSCTPSRDLFFLGKRGACECVGLPGWNVTAFHVPHRPSSTDHAELST
jgi:hypothetical protein